MALKEMTVPDSPKLYTKKYQALLGVDYSCDVTEVDQRRTPTGLNMISDEGANPVKRLGWRTICYLPTINGNSAGKVMKMAVLDSNDPRYDCVFFVMAEHNFYRVKHRNHGSENVDYKFSDSVTIKNGEFVYFGNELYAFLTIEQGGKTFGKYYKATANNVSPLVEVISPYVPEVTINLKPNGTGGASLEPVNLLTPSRMFSFQGNATATNYWFYPKAVRPSTSSESYPWVLANSVVVEELSVADPSDPESDAGWVTLTLGTDYNLSTTHIDISYYDKDMNVQTGTAVQPVIKFTATHPADEALGSDNIRVTFSPVSLKHTYDEIVCDGIYKEATQDLLQGRSAEIYGHTTTDRIFVSGGINKNRVYYSWVNDPTYFPDNNWLNVGYDTNEIQGLVRVSDYLGAIKSDSIYDNTLYLIRGSFLDESMVFTVVPTSAKLGAISGESIKTLINEPLFLTRSGIFGIESVWYSSEKTVRNRSRRVDRKLIKERNLEKACAVVWNKYYILCVNGNCYILDGRKQDNDYTGNTNYEYEAYYWENVPAVAFVTYKDELYFGTADGKICKFNTDVKDRTRYCDNGIENWTLVGDEYHLSIDTEDGQGHVVATAIPCEWSTLLDDDGAPQYFKTLNKKGNLVTLLPQTKTSANVTLVKDGIQWKTLEPFYANIFDWSSINFAEFPFTSNITARDDFVKKKVKKYKRLQIIISNNGMCEPFGILGITKTYYYGNFSK